MLINHKAHRHNPRASSELCTAAVLPTVPLSAGALGGAARAGGAPALQVHVLLPVPLLLQQRRLVHGFNVPLVEGVAAHCGANRYATGGAGNLQGEENLNMP